MISVGGAAVIGGTSGLPAGGTADQVLTGDGDWTDRAVVLEGMVNDVGAAGLRGAIDVYSTAEVDAILPAAPPAVTSITFTNTASKKFNVDVQTRVGGTLQPCVMTFLKLTYLPLDPAGVAVTAGLMQENLTPYFGSGNNLAVTSYFRAVADLTGLMRVEFTGQTAGRVITAEAWSDAPQSAHVTATHTVPA